MHTLLLRMGVGAGGGQDMVGWMQWWFRGCGAVLLVWGQGTAEGREQKAALCCAQLCCMYAGAAPST